jgi:hypothetical protein
MTDFLYLQQLESQPDVRVAAELVESALSSDEVALQLTPAAPTLKSVWANLRKEVHDLLCTNSAKYESERSVIRTTAAPAIAALSAYLVATFALPAASAAALASLALILPIKMAVYTWCNYVQTDADKLPEAELKELKQLTSNIPSVPTEEASRVSHPASDPATVSEPPGTRKADEATGK